MFIRLCNYITRAFCRMKFAKCGKRVRFSPLNSQFSYDSIEMGNNVYVNRNAYFSGKITIGNNVMFGPYVFITDGYHKYDEVGKTIEEQGGAEKIRVFIDDDVWVGAKAAIMKGVHIWEGSVIGTMALVTKDMPPYCICVGNPCKPIKYRYTDDQLREHLKIRGKSEQEIEELINRRREMYLKYR